MVGVPSPVDDDDDDEEVANTEELPVLEDSVAAEAPAIAAVSSPVDDEEEITDEDPPVLEESTPIAAEEPAMAVIPSPVDDDVDEEEVVDEEAPPVLEESVAATASTIAAVPPLAKTTTSVPEKEKNLVSIDDGAATPRITNAASNKKSVSPSVMPLGGGSDGDQGGVGGGDEDGKCGCILHSLAKIPTVCR